MQPHEQQQQRIDEVTRKMEAMRGEIQQIQEERHRVQKIQGKTVDTQNVARASRKMMSNINNTAINYALMSSKQVIDKPIKDQLTLLAQKFDNKLKIGSQNQSSINNTISHDSAATQVHEASSTNDEKIQETTCLPKKRNSIDNNCSQRKAVTMTLEDAVSYLNNVKRVLQNDNKDKIYQGFLNILYNFKSEKCVIPDVEAKVKQLFKDYPQFIAGFQKFSLTQRQTDPPVTNAESSSPVTSASMQTHVIAGINEEKIQQNIKNIKNIAETCSQQKLRMLKVEDALSYLDHVKYTFIDRPQVYSEFLDIMKNFESGLLSTLDVIEKITVLFIGYPHCIIGFNTFLPQGYKIELCPDDDDLSRWIYTPPVTNDNKILKNLRKKPFFSKAPINKEASSQPQENKSVDYSKVSDYVKKVQDRFQNEPKKFNCFLKIIQTFKKKTDNQIFNGAEDNNVLLAKIELLQKIGELFVNNEDLLNDFVQNMQ